MKEKEKIFFVYPPSLIMNRDDKSQEPIGDSICTPCIVPFDMMSLSTIAKNRGYETKFKDYSLRGENIYDFLRDLRVYKPDFIVLNVASTTLEKDLSILSQAQEFLEKTVVIVKGAVFNFNSYSILQKYPEIDIALRGEIEEAFDEIIQYKNLKEIQGITYQTNGKVFQTPDRKAKDNIDNLPFLDRDLINNNFYVRPDNKKTQTVIRVSKGCPNHCFFCLATPLNGKKVRYRSVELIIDEIRECVLKYDISDFIFLSDVFTLDNEWLKKLCELILRQDFKINFCANINVNSVDFSTLHLMKKAGCDILSIGIESCNEEILSKVGKNYTKAQIKNTVSMIEKAGIKTYAHYILGLPWETKESICETFRFAKELNTHYASFHTAAVLLGTKFFDYVRKNRLGEINYEKPYYIPGVPSYGLSCKEIYEYNKRFNKEYYLRLKYLFKIVVDVELCSKIKSYYRAFLKLIKK